MGESLAGELVRRAGCHNRPSRVTGLNDEHFTSGLPTAWGHTMDGRYIMAVYEELDPIVILPVTAYEVPEPR